MLVNSVPPDRRTPKRRLIVVLGMHRSGTSVITRGLEVFEGVSLGNTFLSPHVDNPRGYWEDRDIVQLNIEILQFLGIEWHHLTPIAAEDREKLRQQGYFSRAVELLSVKTASIAIFAFKDPRVPQLLVFWQEVFDHCGFAVSYVIALRNPLSVADSLLKRDGLDAEKSYLLWLGHMIVSLSVTTGKERTIINYDSLMESPDRELARGAKAFNLHVNQQKLLEYSKEFLKESLRHTVFSSMDMLADERCPPLVQDIYSFLADRADDWHGPGDVEVDNAVFLWTNEFQRYKSLLTYIDRICLQKASAIREKEDQGNLLQHSINILEEQKIFLEQEIADRDIQVADRDKKIIFLNDAKLERDALISTLLTSTSWKMTAPCRVGGRFLRRIWQSIVTS
jgi:O-antigen biosynthesis protein